MTLIRWRPFQRRDMAVADFMMLAALMAVVAALLGLVLAILNGRP